MPRDLFDLTGRRALVTGSSRGLGFVMAEALGRAGAQVILNGRSDAASARPWPASSPRVFQPCRPPST